jgi:hypothetical protein
VHIRIFKPAARIASGQVCSILPFGIDSIDSIFIHKPDGARQPDGISEKSSF